MAPKHTCHGFITSSGWNVQAVSVQAAPKHLVSYGVVGTEDSVVLSSSYPSKSSYPPLSSGTL